MGQIKMRYISIIIFLLIFSKQNLAQHLLDSNEISINAAIKKIHNENIISKDSIYINKCKVLIWKVSIPSIYDEVTLMYSFNSFGYCFKYERFSDYKNYKATYEIIASNSTKIDETHFIDDAMVRWTFNFSKGSDYFSLTAEF